MASSDNYNTHPATTAKDGNKIETLQRQMGQLVKERNQLAYDLLALKDERKVHEALQIFDRVGNVMQKIKVTEEVLRAEEDLKGMPARGNCPLCHCVPGVMCCPTCLKRQAVSKQEVSTPGGWAAAEIRSVLVMVLLGMVLGWVTFIIATAPQELKA